MSRRLIYDQSRPMPNPTAGRVIHDEAPHDATCNWLSRGGSAQQTLTRKGRRQNDLATILGYDRFCRLHPAYRHSMSNQLRTFDWIEGHPLSSFSLLFNGLTRWQSPKMTLPPSCKS